MENVKCADYLYKDEFWDLKEPRNSKNQAIYRCIRKKDAQAKNFIICPTYESKLSLQDLKNQAGNIFKRDDTKFVKIIILKKDNNFIILKKNEWIPSGISVGPIQYIEYTLFL